MNEMYEEDEHTVEQLAALILADAAALANVHAEVQAESLNARLREARDRVLECEQAVIHAREGIQSGEEEEWKALRRAERDLSDAQMILVETELALRRIEREKGHIEEVKDGR